jgi:flagellin
MALSINTNVGSLNAQRNLSVSQGQLNKSMQRLSSGLRINNAADDTAGLAISENLRGQIRSQNQASRNANDGVSLIQTAEGALNETSAILVRMRELAQQASTGTVGTTEKGYVQAEFAKLSSEIDRIASTTEFNGTKLLDGSISTNATKMDFQIGTRNTGNDRIGITVGNMNSSSMGLSSVTVDTAANAQSALTSIDTAIASVSSTRGDLGATQNRLQSTINNLQVAIENTSAAESRIRDVDVAAETATMTRNNILTQAGTAILAQANQAPQAALSLLR